MTTDTIHDLTNDRRNVMRAAGWRAVVIQHYDRDQRQRGDIASRHRSYEAAARACDDCQRVEIL